MRCSLQLGYCYETDCLMIWVGEWVCVLVLDPEGWCFSTPPLSAWDQLTALSERQRERERETGVREKWDCLVESSEHQGGEAINWAKDRKHLRTEREPERGKFLRGVEVSADLKYKQIEREGARWAVSCSAAWVLLHWLWRCVSLQARLKLERRLAGQRMRWRSPKKVLLISLPHSLSFSGSQLAWLCLISSHMHKHFILLLFYLFDVFVVLHIFCVGEVGWGLHLSILYVVIIQIKTERKRLK